MVNNKNTNRKAFIGKSTHCTSFGVCEQISLIKFEPPNALNKVLKNNLREYPRDSNLCKNYRKLLNNLPNLKKIEPKYYLTLFKILLYVEYHELKLNMAKHNLKNQTLKQTSDTLVINIPTLDKDNLFVNIDDVVKLQLVNSKRIYYSRVTDIVQQNVYVTLFDASQNSKLSGSIVDVHFVPSDWTIKCYHYVLYIMSKYNLVSLVYPKIHTNPYIYPEFVSDWFNKSVAENPEQQKAVNSILNNSAHPAPYILFGPPGTGKTTTLVETICQIRKHYMSKHILVCTSSNAAADEIAKRLLCILPCKEIFRMYAASTDRLVKLNLYSDHFSYVFIDEASQSIELESLIPLTLISSQNKPNEGILHAQIIVAGDPHQLGPIVQCKRIEHLLGKSLLERLMECEPYQKGHNNEYNSRYITKLIRNYRSKEAILHIPNKLFYDKELICCSNSNINNITSDWTVLSNHTFPIMFFVVKGNEMTMANKSVYNEEEVTVITEFTKKLMCAKLNSYKIQQNNIGIITPFRGQTRKIEERLKMHQLNDITVGTVERFQGREKEIILLSTVRSKCFVHDGREHIGFLSNSKRFNVALTRAKYLLIVVGNQSVLCKDKYWNALWEYCKKNHACFNLRENIR
ncbi:Putative helicase mov-10-B.1 [Habropoda laboriosa]|uniref:Putative helicase mov-10-B.1 n=1 Tax=Habropoda laboriosa TaxID=597456 RepID=A0A0L7QQA9_9HYME|nr:Putative helicase mov-10-B.1 [Habropoda laboriosa]